MRRKDEYSFVSVTKRICRGFLTVEVVPISACSKYKIWTSKNGTTSTEEMPATYSLM